MKTKQDIWTDELFKKVALPIVQELRKHIRLGQCELAGKRFSSDTSVQMELMNYDVPFFKMHPVTCCEKALRQCTAKDYYYSKEKDYDAEAVGADGADGRPSPQRQRVGGRYGYYR